MKILFIAADLSQIGGIQKYVKTLREIIDTLGMKTRLVERGQGGLLAKVYCTLRFYYSILVNRPDFIICTHINFGILCLFAKKIFGIHYSITLYGIESVNLMSVKKICIKNADIVMATFPWTLSNIEQQVPSKRNECMLFPATFNAERFCIQDKSAELLEKYKLNDSKIVLSICRISRQDGNNKGYRRVIKAMKLVLKEIPNAKYILVGGGDDLEGARNLSRECGLERNVIFTGAVIEEEMVQYYNLADVFILPSKNEGFPPIVLLEALSCGIPVIGGNQHGSDLFPWNGDVALIAEADNIQSITDNIVAILNYKAPKKLYNRELLRETILEIYGPESHKRRSIELLHIIGKEVFKK